MKTPWKKIDIEWNIMILACVLLLAFAFPVQKSVMKRFEKTLEQSHDPQLEEILRLKVDREDDDTRSRISASLERSRQWKAMIPIILEEQRNAILAFSIFLFLVLILLALWFLKRLTKPLKNLAQAAEEIGHGKETRIDPISGGALGKLERNMIEMQKELEEFRRTALVKGMEQAWRDIARVMAHEIKNPLTPIRLSLDRLQEKIELKENLDSEDLRRYSERISHQVENLENLVNSFRSFAKEPEVRLKRVRLHESIKAVTDSMKTSLKTEISGDAEIDGDPFLLNQIFLNIAKNSCEADADNLNFEIKDDGQNVMIVIKDNGQGIPDEQLQKVWIPYITFKKNGTGIGLPVVKRLIESLRGTVKLTASVKPEDHGVTMEITFPSLNAGTEGNRKGT